MRQPVCVFGRGLCNLLHLLLASTLPRDGQPAALVREQQRLKGRLEAWKRAEEERRAALAEQDDAQEKQQEEEQQEQQEHQQQEQEQEHEPEA
eukprot:COSAG04_NODE_985_length_8992_cov_18.901844_12_plen_93_part_00